MIHFQDIQFRYEGTISSEIGVKDINLIVHDYEFVCQTCTRLIRFDHHTMTNDILLSQENEATILSLMGLGRDER